jgi:Na+-transporting NADH:ubiquinone oxidoreductase subunit D
LFIWALRAWDSKQVEEPDFRMAKHTVAEESA